MSIKVLKCLIFLKTCLEILELFSYDGKLALVSLESSFSALSKYLIEYGSYQLKVLNAIK